MHAVTGLDASWEAAIFVSAHPGLTSEVERRERLERDEEWARMLREGEPRQFLNAWNAQPVFGGDSASDWQGLLVDTHREELARAFEVWSLGRQEDLRGKLAASGVPQLWVVGARDAKFRAIAEEAVSEIPMATLCVIPGCGHRVLLQKPTVLAECVADFLSQNPNSKI